MAWFKKCWEIKHVGEVIFFDEYRWFLGVEDEPKAPVFEDKAKFVSHLRSIAERFRAVADEIDALDVMDYGGDA